MMNQRETEQRAKRNLSQLRDAINRFQRARMATDAACQGVTKSKKGIPPAVLARRVHDLRDLQVMQRAVDELYDLMSILLQREPTEAELAAGPAGSDGLGNLPAIPMSWAVLSGIGFGAWTLSGLFDYLRSREERIQREMGIPPLEDGSTSFGVGATLVTLGILGVGGFFAYRYFLKRFGGETKALPEKGGE